MTATNSPPAVAPVRLDREIARLTAAAEVSDIHIEEGEAPWVRKSGRLVKTDGPAVKREDMVSFLKHKERETGIAPEKLDSVLAAKGDEDGAFSLGDSRYRLNIYKVNDRRLAFAVRRIAAEIPNIRTMGLPAAFLPLTAQSKGLILVTGATGSGKSTTLASVLTHLNQTSTGHIITVEDPVEYVLQSDKCLIHQRQVKREAKDFHSSLRSALRQDPDVVFVGELRDVETVKMALDAANTGHLVLATLHTMSARQTVERIVSFFPAETRDHIVSTLSQVLLGTLSQCLLRSREGTHRVLACELLLNSPAVRSAIRENKPTALFSAMDTGKREGQVLLNHSLRDLVRSNAVSVEEALYYAYDPQGLQKELGLSK